MPLLLGRRRVDDGCHVVAVGEHDPSTPPPTRGRRRRRTRRRLPDGSQTASAMSNGAMSTVPRPHPEQRRRDPAARLRRLPDPARARPRTRSCRRSTSATATSTRRRATATSRASARRSPQSGLDRGDVFVTSKLNNGAHAPEAALDAFDRTLERARHRLRRPVPHPLAAGHAQQLRRHLEGPRGHLRLRPRARRSASPTSSRPPAPAAGRDDDPAGGEPDRGPPVPDADRGPRSSRASTGSSSRRGRPIAQGKVLDDPTHRADRPEARPVGRPGHAALARAARPRRVPQVGHARPHRGELRASSTSSVATWTWQTSTP